MTETLSPRDVQSLHAINDLLTDSLLRLRTQQSRVSTLLMQTQAAPPPGGEQAPFEAMLARAKARYKVIPWEDGRVDVEVTEAEIIFRFSPEGMLLEVI
jgi:hypothetical protein